MSATPEDDTHHRAKMANRKAVQDARGKRTRQSGERTAIERFSEQVRWHTLGEGFTWETRDRTRFAAGAKAQEGVEF
jgi:ATP:corrinoid adenosyltransferase